MKQQMQTVYIVLSDGRTGSFTGEALVKPEEQMTLRIVDVKFGEPKDLPDGYELEVIGGGK